MPETKVDLTNVTMADLNGKYLAIHNFNTSNDVYTTMDGNNHYLRTLKIEDSKAYDGHLSDDRSEYVMDKLPVVELATADVTKTDADGKETTETVDVINYVAKRNNIARDVYEQTNSQLHQSQIIGTDDHAKAVAFLEAIAHYLRSAQMFSFDKYASGAYTLVDSIKEVGGDASGDTTTTTTTVKPEDTTTTTTKAPEAPAKAEAKAKTTEAKK